MRVFSSVSAALVEQRKTKKNFTVPHFRTNVRTVFFMKYCCAWKVINYIRKGAHFMKISIFFIRISLHRTQNIALSMNARRGDVNQN